MAEQERTAITPEIVSIAPLESDLIDSIIDSIIRVEAPFVTMVRVGNEPVFTRGVDLIAMSKRLEQEQFLRYLGLSRQLRELRKVKK